MNFALREKDQLHWVAMNWLVPVAWTRWWVAITHDSTTSTLLSICSELHDVIRKLKHILILSRSTTEIMWCSHSTDFRIENVGRVWIPGTNFIYFLKWKKLLSLLFLCKTIFYFPTSEIQLRDWNSASCSWHSSKQSCARRKEQYNISSKLCLSAKRIFCLG